MPQSPRWHRLLPTICAASVLLAICCLCFRSPAPERSNHPTQQIRTTSTEEWVALRPSVPTRKDPIRSKRVALKPRIKEFIRARGPALIDFDAIASAGRGETEELMFHLEPGQPPLGGSIARRDHRSDTSFTLHGKFEGTSVDGWWSLNRNRGVVAANFHLPDGGPYYEWRYTPQSIHEQRLIDPTGLPTCQSGAFAFQHLAEDLPPMQADEYTTEEPVDVHHGVEPGGGNNGGGGAQAFLHQAAIMVLYTPAAVDAVGGSVAMEGLVFLAVDETNAAFADSRVRPRLHLVHHQQINYTESNNLTTDLTRLARTADGQIDIVHDLRNAHGADLVSMLVVNDFSCGLALTTVNNAQPGAFSVVAQDCAVTAYTFAHEVAHNFGCQHARNDSGNPAQSLYPFGFAWRFDVPGQAGDILVFRTIMAQSPGHRIPLYSNPQVSFEGEPTGVPVGSPEAAYNARALTESAAMVAAWRATSAVPYGDRLGQPDWQFVSGGNAPWTLEREPIEPVGVDDPNGGVQAGRLQANGASWIQTSLQGPLQVNFLWRLERNNANSAAYLSVHVDDIEFLRLDSNSEWEEAFVRIPVGTHTVRWTQHRGEAGSSMDSQGWIDQITTEIPPFRIHEAWLERDDLGGKFRMIFDSIPGQRYRVEATRALEEWFNVRQFISDDPGVYRSTISLPDAQSPDNDQFPRQRIYRIRMVD